MQGTKMSYLERLSTCLLELCLMRATPIFQASLDEIQAVSVTQTLKA